MKDTLARGRLALLERFAPKNPAAIDALEHAISRCWSDANQIRFDPAFAALRERPAIQELVLRAQSKVLLPPPIGAGGLPEM